MDERKEQLINSILDRHNRSQEEMFSDHEEEVLIELSETESFEHLELGPRFMRKNTNGTEITVQVIKGKKKSFQSEGDAKFILICEGLDGEVLGLKTIIITRSDNFEHPHALTAGGRLTTKRPGSGAAYALELAALNQLSEFSKSIQKEIVWEEANEIEEKIDAISKMSGIPNPDLIKQLGRWNELLVRRVGFKKSGNMLYEKIISPNSTEDTTGISPTTPPTDMNSYLTSLEAKLRP